LGSCVFCSVCTSRTVREDQADSPRRPCSSDVLRVLALLSFRSVVVLSFHWAKFWTVRVYRADGPRVPGGQSACSPRTVRYSGSVLEVLFALTDGPRLRSDSPRQGCEQSAVPCRTVRTAIADSPPCLARRSARGCQLCFLVRFLPPFLVLLCVLQGIVPKTRG
jgi:hypothetical protein